MPRANSAASAAATAAVETFPLDRLVLSELNVRKTERDADIAALAEDISARGLKQNLVVTPVDDTPEGKLEVIAGGRRYQALQLLADAGRIAGDHPVPCLVEERSEARETSLSENLHRVAMNPADEFEAFAAIVTQHTDAGKARGESVELCARRFGKTVDYVEGRLRLADLAPEILQALRENRIGIEAAKAYATNSDHKLQLQVFKEREKDSWHGHKPQTIRERMRGKTVQLTDPRMTYVGLDAYREAGGRTEAEMFMGTSGEERAIDCALLDRLVKAKAEEALPAIAKRAGYKEGLFATGTGWQARWPKAPKGFERAYDYYSAKKPTKAKLKKSVAVYAVDEKGKGLTLVGRFKPAEEKDDRSGGYRPATPEEVAERRREQGISTIAARLAVGKFADTPLEGRAFWPARGNWIDPIEAINETEVLVAVQVKVTVADIDAQREAAATKYDEELAAAEAEKLRQAEAIAVEQGADVGEALDDIEAEEEPNEEVAA